MVSEIGYTPMQLDAVGDDSWSMGWLCLFGCHQKALKKMYFNEQKSGLNGPQRGESANKNQGLLQRASESMKKW